MPYEIDPNNRKCIRKADSKKRVGCTKGSVKKYLAALHANVNESTGGKYDFLMGSDLVGSEIRANDTLMTITKISPYTSKDRVLTISSENPFYDSEDINSNKMFEADILESDLINALNNGQWTINTNQNPFETLNESEENELGWAEDIVSQPPLEFRGKEILIDIRDLNSEERESLVDILEDYMEPDDYDYGWPNDCFRQGEYRKSKVLSISLHCGIEDYDYIPKKGLICCLTTTYEEDQNKGNIIPLDGRDVLNYYKNSNINESEEDDLAWVDTESNLNGTHFVFNPPITDFDDYRNFIETLSKLNPDIRWTGFLENKGFLKDHLPKSINHFSKFIQSSKKYTDAFVDFNGQLAMIKPWDPKEGYDIGRRYNQVNGWDFIKKNINESEEDLEWAEDTVNANPTYRFGDLVFKPHHITGAVRARLNFPNGHYISVVGGPHLYGDGVDTFEIWGSDTEDPEGYLTKADVTNRMIELQNLPPLEGNGTFKKEPITESEELEWAQDAVSGLDHYEEYDGQELSNGTVLMINGEYEDLYFEDQWAKVARQEHDDTYLIVFPSYIENDGTHTHCGDPEYNDSDEYDCGCNDSDSQFGNCWFIDLTELDEVKVFPNLRGFINENKSLLTEGRYDAITRKVVQDVMHVVTNTKGNEEEVVQAELPNTIRSEEYEYLQEGLGFSVELNVHHQYLYHDRNALKESDAYFVDAAIAEGDDNVIMLTVVVDPTWEPQIYEKLFYKLQEVVRHEIEHLTQSGYYRIEDRPKSTTSTAKLKTVYGHHKHKIEVPALVHGFYRRAKIEKRPIDEVMIEDLDSEIEKGNLSKKQAENLLKTWVEYAKQHLPKAKYSD